MFKKLFATKKARIIAWAVVILAIGAFLYFTAPKAASVPTNANNQLTGNLPAAGNTNANTNKNAPKPVIKKPAATNPVGFTEKKTPHFVSATIANNATLTEAPTKVTINFDAPLIKTTESFLSVKKDDITDITVNKSTIGNISLVVGLNPKVTDGDYYVYYVACFADVGCKDGRFGYRLNLP
jgi:methionine-rich copper-binding protein CopC